MFKSDTPNENKDKSGDSQYIAAGNTTSIYLWVRSHFTYTLSVPTTVLVYT